MMGRGGIIRVVIGIVGRRRDDSRGRKDGRSSGYKGSKKYYS